MQLKAISVYLQNKLRMPARRKMSANQGLYKQKGPLIKAGSFQPQRIAKNFFERQLKLFYLYIAERSRCSAVQPLQANLSLSWDFSLLVLCEPRRYHNSVRSLFVVGPLRQVDFRRMLSVHVHVDIFALANDPHLFPNAKRDSSVKFRRNMPEYRAVMGYRPLCVAGF